MSNCSSCLFYKGTSIGLCHRFPATTRVQSIHWCGEHKAFEKPAIVEDKSKKSRGFRLPPAAASQHTDKL